MRLPSSLHALAEPRFRLLWSGQTTSAIGDGLVPVAMAFAVLRIGGNASSLGLVMTGGYLARIVFLLIGGVWADRLPRQLVMLASDVVRAATQMTLAVLLITGQARVWHLLAGAIVYGVAAAFFTPASSGLIPQTVSIARLQQANALMGLSKSGNRVIGPALSGVLVAAIGPGWVLGIDGLTFLVSAASLAMLKLAPVDRPPRRGFVSDLAAGWHELAIRSWYWLNLCTHALWNVAYAFFFVLGPVVAAQRLGGAWAWGAISACVGLGLVAGGFVALRVVPVRPLVAGNLALIPAGLFMVALALPLPLVLIAVATVIGYTGLMFLNEVWDATMQQLIPAQVLSRVSAYDYVISLIATPIGFAIAGPASIRIGTAATLLSGAALMSIPSLLIVLLPGVRQVIRTPEGLVIEHRAASN